MRHRRLLYLRGTLVVTGLLIAACGQVEEPTAQSALTATSVPDSTLTSDPIVSSTGVPASTITSTTERTSITVRGFGPPVPLEGTSPLGAVVALTDTTAVATSESGLIAVGSERGDVRIYTAGGEALGVADDAHAGAVSGLGFRGESDELVSSGEDGRVRLWHIAGSSLDPGPEWEPHDGVAVVALALSSTGTTIATAGGDRLVRLWEAPVEDPPTKVEEFGPVDGTEVTALAIEELPDGPPVLVAGTSQGDVVVLSGSDVAADVGIPIVTDSEVADLAVMPDRTAVVVAGDEPLTLLGLDDGSTDAPNVSPDVPPSSSSIDVWGSPAGGDVLLVVGSEGRVDVFTDHGARPVSFTGLRDTVDSAAFLRDGSALVIADRSRVVVLPIARD